MVARGRGSGRPGGEVGFVSHIPVRVAGCEAPLAVRGWCWVRLGNADPSEGFGNRSCELGSFRKLGVRFVPQWRSRLSWVRFACSSPGSPPARSGLPFWSGIGFVWQKLVRTGAPEARLAVLGSFRKFDVRFIRHRRADRLGSFRIFLAEFPNGLLSRYSCAADGPFCVLAPGRPTGGTLPVYMIE